MFGTLFKGTRLSGRPEEAARSKSRQTGLNGHAVIVRSRQKTPDFEELTDDILRDITTSSFEVLTGCDDGKPIFVPKAASPLICFTSTGMLLVSQSNPRHAVVGEVVEAIARLPNYEIKHAYLAPLEIINQLNDRGQRMSISESSLERMQKDVFEILEQACDWKATDIKVELKHSKGSVRFCVNGIWLDVREWTADYTRTWLASAFNTAGVGDGTYKENDFQMARLSSSDHKLPRNLESIRMQFAPGAYAGDRMLVARLLLQHLGTRKTTSIGDLGYDVEHMTIMQRIRDTPFGVVFMSGPTGSGKSTTLKVSLEHRYVEMNREIHVLTIEDPPEYDIMGASQLPVSNVNTEEERADAFVRAFNAVLRMKPDVIMVGEVRDLPAAKLLLKASISGHQCWTSVHCSSALSIPLRLKDMGVDSFVVKDSSIMIGMAFQRLVPKLCPHCALPYDIGRYNPEVDRMVDIICDGDISSVKMRNPKGCQHCTKERSAKPGYSGQTVAAEVLRPDDDILTACIEGRREDAIRAWLAQPLAMLAFEHGLRKVFQGVVDPKDIYHGLYDDRALERLLHDEERRSFIRIGRDQPTTAQMIASAALRQSQIVVETPSGLQLSRAARSSGMNGNINGNMNGKQLNGHAVDSKSIFAPARPSDQFMPGVRHLAPRPAATDAVAASVISPRQRPIVQRLPK